MALLAGLALCAAGRSHAADVVPAAAPAHTQAPAAGVAIATSGTNPAPTAPALTPDGASAAPESPASSEEMTASPDDPDSQEEVDRSAAELDAVRRAEEKAGLLPAAPGQGPRDALAVGLDPSDPLARDLAAALGTSLDGAPLADPTCAGATQLLRLAELAGISEQELRAKYDIPVELNDAVIAYVRFFQTDARAPFARWLARSGRFLPLVRPVLEKQGVPIDLVYLSMIESGFNPYAYSTAKAAGMWQFVVGTSRRYGLLTDFWVDERRDPLKSTLAAAHYLRDLKDRFHGDWYLAWAGYNAGEGKIDKAIRKESTTDFWRMMEKGRTLRAETKHYVPKLIAAALIGKHPERFGFHVEEEQPWQVDEVTVPDATDLHVIAKAAGTDFDTVRELNPELRRFCTPPGGWTIRLPKGTKDAFVTAYAKLGPAERLSFTAVRVEKGEPLGKIARAYGVPEQAILRTNGLKSPRQIKVGALLVIPMAQSKSGLAAGNLLEDKRGRAARAQGRSAALAVSQAASRKPAAPASSARGSYRVKPGDSLWTIAARFSTTVDKLKRLNGLTGRRASALQVGQTIAVKDEES